LLLSARQLALRELTAVDGADAEKKLQLLCPELAEDRISRFVGGNLAVEWARVRVEVWRTSSLSCASLLPVTRRRGAVACCAA
jgi:hypothetical protein